MNCWEPIKKAIAIVHSTYHQRHPLHPYSKYKWNKNAKNVIYNVIYLLKYSKVGPITCIVCHANANFRFQNP